jgi:hypothetical protein
VRKIPSIQFYTSQQDTINSILLKLIRYRQLNFTQAERYRQFNFTQADKSINSIFNKPTRYRQFTFTQADKLPSIQFLTNWQDTVNSFSHKPIPSILFYSSPQDTVHSILQNPKDSVNSFSPKPTIYRQFDFKQGDKIPSIQFYTSRKDSSN